MPIITGIASVPANATVPVFALPPGYCNFTMYQPTSPQQVWVGQSAAMTTASGMPVPNTPLNQESFSGSRGQLVYATTGNATASSFYYIISSTG